MSILCSTRPMSEAERKAEWRDRHGRYLAEKELKDASIAQAEDMQQAGERNIETGYSDEEMSDAFYFKYGKGE